MCCLALPGKLTFVPVLVVVCDGRVSPHSTMSHINSHEKAHGATVDTVAEAIKRFKKVMMDEEMKVTE